MDLGTIKDINTNYFLKKNGSKQKISCYKDEPCRYKSELTDVLKWIYRHTKKISTVRQYQLFLEKTARSKKVVAKMNLLHGIYKFEKKIRKTFRDKIL
jgi:hypothetical protein